MYLIITEDGTAYKAKKITEGDMSCCDDGLLTVIDTNTLQDYYQGEWTDIEEYITEEEECP